MAPVPVKVKLLKEMYHVDVDVDDNPIVFREAVEAACGVPPGKFLKVTNFIKKRQFQEKKIFNLGSQRMKLKGKLLPNPLESWDEYKEFIVEGALFMIMQ